MSHFAPNLFLLVSKKPEPLTSRVVCLGAWDPRAHLLTSALTGHKGAFQTLGNTLGNILATLLPVELARLSFADANHLRTRDDRGRLGIL